MCVLHNTTHLKLLCIMPNCTNITRNKPAISLFFLQENNNQLVFKYAIKR